MSYRSYRGLLPAILFLLLPCWMPTFGAEAPEAPAVTVTITSPAAGAVVGGSVRIENRVTHPADVKILFVATQATEVGTPALILPLSSDWPEEENEQDNLYPVGWDTLPMHNGECRLTTRVVCRQGDRRFTVVSAPVSVLVRNLWITRAAPATAFFAVKAGESQTVTVDFDHYLAAGPYRIEYTFRRVMMNTTILRTIVHEKVTAHRDSCVFTADRESFPFGAYICFNVRVSCGNDAAALISPTCRVILDDAEIHDGDDTARIVYALSEPPAPGGLTVLCYSDLKFISSREGLSEQCRDWEHPVEIPFTEDSFRSIFVGLDNHTDNRGRAPQRILPES